MKKHPKHFARTSSLGNTGAWVLTILGSVFFYVVIAVIMREFGNPRPFADALIPGAFIAINIGIIVYSV
jgi:uncharacterized membrane protein